MLNDDPVPCSLIFSHRLLAEVKASEFDKNRTKPDQNGSVAANWNFHSSQKWQSSSRGTGTLIRKMKRDPSNRVNFRGNFSRRLFLSFFFSFLSSVKFPSTNSSSKSLVLSLIFFFFPLLVNRIRIWKKRKRRNRCVRLK